MPEAWQSLTLGDVFQGLNQGLGNIHSQASDLFDKYSAVANQLNEKVNAIERILNGTGILLEKLQNTGIYVLNLKPSGGNLVSRIANAQNPPTGDYSAGIVLGVSSADIQKVAQTYANLMEILTKPIEVPK